MSVCGRRFQAILARLFLSLGLLLVAAGQARAERLPIKIYTTADGLAHNVVSRVVRDSRGFLWFCTGEGLSRFDGYSFTNYTIDQGLPSALINDFLETGEGDYWVATSGGLCRFNPLGKPQTDVNNASERNAPDAMFTVYFPGDDARSKHILSLLQDRAGRIWCGTRNGLYLVEASSTDVKFTFTDLGIPDHFESRFIECLLEDRRGALWVGSRSGLYRLLPDRRVEAYTIRDGLPHHVIFSLLEDREGHMWVGTGFGWLCRLVPDPAPGRNVVARAYTDKDGLPTPWINQLFQATDGSLWAGSSEGLIRFIPTADGRDFRFRVYTQAHGLSYQSVASLAEDRNGNLWLAITEGGVAKIARSGFTTFGNADGFFWSTSILETRAGDVLVLGGPVKLTEGFINRFDGEKFIPVRPRFPESIVKHGYGWGWNQTVLEDHTGEWWMATAAGVCRFPKVSKPEQLAHTPPRAIYTMRDGLAADMILRLFEDSRGDIWIGSVGHGERLNGLSRWERSANSFHHYTEKDNLPRFDTFFVSSFAEDRAGNLWIGFSGDGGLARYRAGRFTLFTADDGVPSGQIRNLLVDSAGRLWAASYRSGLIRIDDPAAERPRFVTYTTADGLSSNEIAAVSEDGWGRIHIGTGRGIDRLDLATGRVKHYTTADGLPLTTMHATLRDRKGALWFSFQTGTARLVPEPDPPPVPPPVLITGLRIAGETHQISALGQTEIAPIELGPDNSQLQIDFVALGFSPGEGLRYQYKLEGSSEDWSHLADQRTVNFANLAPGRYRFLVRAVNADGVTSERPAGFSFNVLPPLWQRWWFVAMVAMALFIIVYSVYRYRLKQKLELEQMRTRIAADLHDDIGANLTKIAILSEVAHQQMGAAGNPADKSLSSIATISRESVASMRDIVWAINPRRDRLLDLTRRMRGFASDIFTSRNIEFRFSAPEGDRALRLSPKVRRDVFLIFKEAVNNVARHSECAKAAIEVHVESRHLVLSVADDGKGFDASQVIEGQGLLSMRQRAESFGGQLEIISRVGTGTTVRLKVPVSGRLIRAKSRIDAKAHKNN
jgi:ligand-binding sensor domain-containing protein/two-component sensor histidine kinase